VQVVEGSLFSGSTQHLQARNAVNYDLGIVFDQGTQIVSVSFDLITRANEPVGATTPVGVYLLASFYGSTPHVDSGHVHSTNRLTAAGINTHLNRVGGGGSAWAATNIAHGTLAHYNVVMNNSVNTFNYSLAGTEYEIPAGQAAVFINDQHVYTLGYLQDSVAPDKGRGQDIQAFSFTTLSSAGRNSYDLDNFAVYAIPEPSTYALIFGGLVLAGAFIVRRRRR
jgi:hypothetical protein